MAAASKYRIDFIDECLRVIMKQYRLFLNGFWLNADYFNENDFEINILFFMMYA